MDDFRIRQGETLALTATLADGQGQPITIYSGTEPLSATCWPGGNLAASFAPAVAWRSGPDGTIDLTASGPQTLALAQGRYFGSISLEDPALGPLEAYRFTLDVTPSPGSAAYPDSYCGYADLLEFGRSWLHQFQSEDDLAGFARQCGRARSWLDDLLLGGWTVSNSLTLGDPGYGAALTGQGNGRIPSVYLRGILAGGGLIKRDLVVEVCALKALSLICRGQVGPGKDQDFARLGRIYGAEANELVKTLRAEIDTNGDGLPEFAINLGETSMR